MSFLFLENPCNGFLIHTTYIYLYVICIFTNIFQYLFPQLLLIVKYTVTSIHLFFDLEANWLFYTSDLQINLICTHNWLIVSSTYASKENLSKSHRLDKFDSLMEFFFNLCLWKRCLFTCAATAVSFNERKHLCAIQQETLNDQILAFQSRQ